MKIKPFNWQIHDQRAVMIAVSQLPKCYCTVWSKALWKKSVFIHLNKPSIKPCISRETVYTLLMLKPQEGIWVLITWEKDGQTLLHFTFPNWKLIGKNSGDLGYLVESKNWVWLTHSYVTITGHGKIQRFAKYSLQQSVVKSFMQWEIRFSWNWSL